MKEKELKPKHDGKRKQFQKPNEIYLSKSRAAALQQTKLHMEKQSQQNITFIRVDEKELTMSPTVYAIFLSSESTQSSPLKVYRSENKFDFVVTSPNSPEIPTACTSKISTPKKNIRQ